MTYPHDILESQASPEPVINANGRAVAWAATYGKDAFACAGLSWAYFGGRWGGFAVPDGVLTLASSRTNYLVVARATGALALAANLAAYNDAATNAKVYAVTTSAVAVTVEQDDRAGPGGVHGGGAGAPPPAAAPVGIPQIVVAADHTTTLAEAGSHYYLSAGGPYTVTIEANAGAAYAIGTALTFVVANGAGAIVIAINADTLRLAGTGATGPRSLAANGRATALKIAATEWQIGGVGLT